MNMLLGPPFDAVTPLMLLLRIVLLVLLVVVDDW
jgi:hypothetical protein